jgi:hypothetical protein
MSDRVSLTVLPDPEEPAGGYAFLELPGGSLDATQVHVAVQESYGDRWLAPAVDVVWQSARHDFGPCKVYRHDGADWIRIGPEIVDRMEEYTPVRFAVGPVVGEVVWPDNVLPRAAGAVLGALRPVARNLAAPDGERAMKAPAPPRPEPEAAPEPEPEPEPEAPVVTTEPDPARTPRRWPWLIPALLALLALAWWLLWRDGPEVVVVPPADPVVQPDPLDPGDRAAVDGCDEAALTALAGGFDARVQKIRDCGARVPADLALRIIEDAAAADDPQALLLFGTLYDGRELDPRIENLIGLSFDDDPVQATVYYARAVAAGSDVARARLTATCARLAQGATTLQKGAFHDHCR